VIWLLKLGKVSVAESATFVVDPVAVGVAGMLLQSMTPEGSMPAPDRLLASIDDFEKQMFR